MFRPTSILSRFLSVLLTLLLVNLAVPMTAGKWIGEAAPGWFPHGVGKPKVLLAQSRPLSAREMKKMEGKWTKNPYVAGANKWSVSYKGVDLITENFTTSGTDLTFEGGYGIPVNVTRSYSANAADEGPLGIGWTLSVDVRSTAGGVLKSSGAPIRTVPVAFKERNSSQTIDPAAETADGSATQPPQAVLATDASGKEETEQRDADGIITTPPWDKNTNNPQYEYVSFGSSTYQILTHNETITPDGTTYVYDKQGDYGTGGVTSINGSGSAEPSNVLKITSVTDRQGNTTTYTYNTTSNSYGPATVSFAKSNGTTTEHPLTHILMPNGHQINFTWGNGTNAPTNRIRTADDNVTSGRTVTYGYDSNGNLTSVTSPAGLTTNYGYNYVTAASGSTYTPSSTEKVLNSITDPRGLTTSIGYTLEQSTIAPYMVTMEAVRAYKVIMPNGVTTYYVNTGIPVPTDSYYYGGTSISELAAYSDTVGGTPFQSGYLEAYASSGSGTPYFEVGMAGIGGYDSPGITGGTTWRKQYDSQTQNLIYQVQYCSPLTNTLTTNRAMNSTNDGTKVEVSDTYNFMGNKLSETTTEATHALPTGGTYTNTRVQTTDYAYWGADKYFQQKATRIQTGASTYRYTFTDFYDNSSPAGVRGQTKAVYSPAFSTFSLDTGITPPSGTASGDYWKYQLVVDNTPAAKFYDGSGTPAYDSKGRVTDVWKLQSTATTPWTYVQTHTTYGADNSPHWGQAYQVVEDYGAGHINRTTTTNAYTSWGTADDVTDAAGHEFVTSYDADQKINDVRQVDHGLNQTIVSYSYGTSGITNGQPTQVTDGLSTVVQAISYNDGTSTTYGASNYIGGIGQPSSASENDPGSITYGTSYVYDGAGARIKATYSRNGTQTARWGYTDYVSVGNPSAPSRVFQTVVKLDTSDNPTSEELHYSYDGSGRLLVATFAQTPQSGFTPSTGNSYYDSSHVASTRARAYYVYDSGGRITQLNYWWDVSTSSNAYGTPEAILSNACAYEVSTGTSNYNRGLKTESDFYFQSPSDHTAFALDHQELYGYDNNVDYLTSASYNGGSTTTAWSYDAAGNRNDVSAVDNLNRATTISGTTRTYDILGNTTNVGSTKSMAWDVASRMSSFISGSTTTNYAYRSDGMRVNKAIGTQTVTYGYDGQMPVEECLIDSGTSSNSTTTRYGLGARGIDRVEATNSSGTAVVYPIYDSHGNMLTTLAKSGSGYTYAPCRFYDVWGGIRSGGSSGSPSLRHCASQGHIQDDESGFIYMRARYYESVTGRFTSEDSAHDGLNWYSYCQNEPVMGTDFSGHEPEQDPTTIRQMWAQLALILAYLLGGGGGGTLAKLVQKFPRIPPPISRRVKKFYDDENAQGEDTTEFEDTLIFCYELWRDATVMGIVGLGVWAIWAVNTAEAVDTAATAITIAPQAGAGFAFGT